jgi:MPBQ/MSBQ methyltransferase
VNTKCSEAIVRLYDERMYDELVDEYYDSSGFMNYGYWEENTPDAKTASENLMKELLSLIPQKRGTILDVACGRGATTKYLLKFYNPEQITGINISEKQLTTCRKLAPGCRFLLMDAVKLQFEECSFDTLLCVEAAFHFNTRWRFFQEAFRVLKPGGDLVMADVLISKVSWQKRPHMPVANFIESLDEYREVIRSAGFSNFEIHDVTRQCWEGGFWSIFRFAHEKFLKGVISSEQLFTFLDRVYQLCVDLRHYVLVRATK